jgi:hypothetical protein
MHAHASAQQVARQQHRHLHIRTEAPTTCLLLLLVLLLITPPRPQLRLPLPQLHCGRSTVVVRQLCMECRVCGCWPPYTVLNGPVSLQWTYCCAPASCQGRFSCLVLVSRG